MFIKILQIIAVIATILTGLVSLINPQSVQGFTGLTAPGARGITEIRSILGGLSIGLGIAYLGVALVRGISMFVDKSVVQSNVISLVVEIIFGIILVLPA